MASHVCNFPRDIDYHWCKWEQWEMRMCQMIQLCEPCWYSIYKRTVTRHHDKAGMPRIKKDLLIWSYPTHLRVEKYRVADHMSTWVLLCTRPCNNLSCCCMCHRKAYNGNSHIFDFMVAFLFPQSRNTAWMNFFSTTWSPLYCVFLLHKGFTSKSV